MNRLAAILLLLCAGCAAPLPGNHVVQSNNMVQPAAVPSSINLPPSSPAVLPAFQYPPSPTNYTFTLQESDDLQTWSDVATFQPHAQPSGIYDIVGNGNHKFYRMKGTP